MLKPSIPWAPGASGKDRCLVPVTSRSSGFPSIGRAGGTGRAGGNAPCWGWTGPIRKLSMRDEALPTVTAICRALSEQIGHGLLPAGGKLPAERKLSELFATTRITLREALIQLESQGLIYREERRGWFVSPSGWPTTRWSAVTSMRWSANGPGAGDRGSVGPADAGERGGLRAAGAAGAVQRLPDPPGAAGGRAAGAVCQSTT